MSYISLVHDYESDKILVWERENGERVLRSHNPPRYFYVPDENGEYKTIDDTRATKKTFDTKEEFNSALKQFPIKFESDVSPAARVLMDYYYGRQIPKIHWLMYDIEVDYKSKAGGFSRPENPYAPINAVTCFLDWKQEYATLVVPPAWWKSEYEERFLNVIKELEQELGLEGCNVELCRNEAELLAGFLGCIEDADLVSGWNSEFFDNPYIIKRLEINFGPKGARKMCFPNAAKPKERYVSRFGSEVLTYQLSGRTHVDFLDLFKKFTYEGRASYSLANIAAEEIDIPKLDYIGTLEELYNGTHIPKINAKMKESKILEIQDKLTRLNYLREFCRLNNDERFQEIDIETKIYSLAIFTAYNHRDVQVIKRLNNKFKFIEMLNQMAHENTVPFEAILGTVRYVETGIMNRAHYEHKRICLDKVRPLVANSKVEGAVVLTPAKGLHEWLAAVDIKSLYPNVIMSLGMSIETFVGQFINEHDDWIKLRDFRQRQKNVTRAFDKLGSYTNIRYRSPEQMAIDKNSELTVKFANNTFETRTVSEWNELLERNNWAVSAFGSIFDQKMPGMVADTLSYWFAERIRLQSEKKKCAKEAEKLKEELCVNIDGDVRHDQFLKIKNKYYSKIDYEKIQELEKRAEHYDLLQLTKKIQLNSTYGALLNENFRFGRREIGASVTATGREITLHMIEFIGFILSGAPAEVEKYFIPDAKDEEGGANRYITDHPYIIYSDTDSLYFKTGASNLEEAILISNEAAAQANSSFPEFMQKYFNCKGKRSTLIEANREIVGIRGLFLSAKKKYTIRVFDKEGKRVDELKSMGSEIKKADTPKAVQDFLKNLMGLILDGKQYPELETFVNNNRHSLIRNNKELLLLGSSKQINKLDTYYAEYKRTEKVSMGKCKLPGHVRAAINYNEMLEHFNDTENKELFAGDKGMVFYLKPNQFGLKSIAFSSDTEQFPSWFDENFAVDMRLTEEKMIDMKLRGIFEALDQMVPTPQTAYVNSVFTF